MSENSSKAGVTAGVGTVGVTAAAASGMSAAQMTATLATIGSAVGGGMIAGITTVAAAPVVIGLAVATVFDLFDW